VALFGADVEGLSIVTADCRDRQGFTPVHDKVRQSVTEQSKSKKHGPITSSDQTIPTQIQACDWSMLFAFALLRNTLTHFVILLSPTYALFVKGTTQQRVAAAAVGDVRQE